MSKIWIALLLVSFAFPADAQYSASQDAQHIATLKAVVNYKIDDEELSRDIAKLRENRNFNLKLQKMLEKLSNRRTKDGTNRKVLKILEKAGEDIYKVLD